MIFLSVNYITKKPLVVVNYEGLGFFGIFTRCSFRLSLVSSFVFQSCLFHFVPSGESSRIIPFSNNDFLMLSDLA